MHNFKTENKVHMDIKVQMRDNGGSLGFNSLVTESSGRQELGWWHIVCDGVQNASRVFLR